MHSCFWNRFSCVMLIPISKVMKIKCSFSVTVSMTDGTYTSLVSSATVFVKPMDLSPVIAGPSKRKIGTDQVLVLDGSGSTDPSNSLLEPTYSWTCEQVSIYSLRIMSSKVPL